MSASEQSITAIVSMLLLTASQLQEREKEQAHRIKPALPASCLPTRAAVGLPNRQSCFHWVIDQTVLRDPQTALLTQNLLIQSLGYLAIGERFTLRLSGKTVDWVLFKQPMLATVDTLLRARQAIMLLCSGATPRNSGFSAVSPERVEAQTELNITAEPMNMGLQVQVISTATTQPIAAFYSYRIDSVFAIRPQLSKLFDHLSDFIHEHHDESADELSSMVGLLLRLCAVHWWWYYDQCDRLEPAASRAMAA